MQERHLSGSIERSFSRIRFAGVHLRLVIGVLLLVFLVPATVRAGFSGNSEIESRESEATSENNRKTRADLILRLSTNELIAVLDAIEITDANGGELMLLAVEFKKRLSIAGSRSEAFSGLMSLSANPLTRKAALWVIDGVDNEWNLDENRTIRQAIAPNLSDKALSTEVRTRSIVVYSRSLAREVGWKKPDSSTESMEFCRIQRSVYSDSAEDSQVRRAALKSSVNLGCPISDDDLLAGVVASQQLGDKILVKAEIKAIADLGIDAAVPLIGEILNDTEDVNTGFILDRNTGFDLTLTPGCLGLLS